MPNEKEIPLVEYSFGSDVTGITVTTGNRNRPTVQLLAAAGPVLCPQSGTLRMRVYVDRIAPRATEVPLATGLVVEGPIAGMRWVQRAGGSVLQAGRLVTSSTDRKKPVGSMIWEDVPDVRVEGQ